MMSSAELKKKAKRDLKGNYAIAIGAMLLVMIIVGIIQMGISMFFSMLQVKLLMDFDGSIKTGITVLLYAIVQIIISSLVVIPVTALFSPGLMKIYLNISTGTKNSIGTLFHGFNIRFYRYIGLYLVLDLLGIACMLPGAGLTAACFISMNPVYMAVGCVVSTIVTVILIMWVFITYSQGLFLLVDDGSNTVFGSLKKSRQMMHGHKLFAIYLGLSFIGMFILVYLSMGIGMLWLMPYMSCTYAGFFLQLKKEQAEIIR